MTATRERAASVALLLVLGGALVVTLGRVMDAYRPDFATRYEGEPLYLTPRVARRASLAFNGLLADWYWIRSIDYIGHKIKEAQGRQEIDLLSSVNKDILVPLLDMVTTLDPKFTPVYEFAAIMLPSVDFDGAVKLARKGIADNPTSLYLRQQLAYIQWRHHDYAAAAQTFRDGARLAGATWMNDLALRMEAEGGDRGARMMYVQMYAHASDPQIKDFARRRLLQVRAFEDRETLTRIVADFRHRTGDCPLGWRDVADALQARRLTVDAAGEPLDPSGVPWLLVVGPHDCEIRLGLLSKMVL